MDNKQKEFINFFVKNSNKNDEEFNLVLNKLNEFLSPFFIDLQENYNNEIFFNLKLIGEQFLGSNYDYSECANILIETNYINAENLEYSQRRSKKGEIGKLLADSFNYSQKSILPTISELQNLLYKYLILRNANFKIYNRKNCIYFNLLDYKFSLTFVEKTTNNTNEVIMSLRGKEYSFDLTSLHNNLLKKNQETKENFFNLVKFYKVMEKELSLINKLYINGTRNLYFYENLLYNIPNELLNNNYIYDNFIASYNYLLEKQKNKEIDLLVDATNNILLQDNYKLFAKYYFTNYDFYKVIKQCKVFIDNIDNIVAGKN